MPPHPTRPLLATCCRIRLPTPTPWLGSMLGRPSQSAMFSGTGNVNASAKIIVLEPPRRRNPVFDLPEPAVDPLDNVVLEDVSKKLLTYEQEALMDMTRMEISLHKPPKLKVSARRHQQLHDQLTKCFNPIQLRSFYSHHRDEDNSLPKMRANMAKTKVVDAILNHVWKVEIAEEIAPREDYIMTKEIKSTSRDIFFLLSDDALILRTWANRCSARITVNALASSLEIQASEASIERIEGLIKKLMSTMTEEEIDISVLERVGKFNEEFIAPISRTTRTFIERKDENTLRISALHPARDRLDDARRLLMTSVNMEFRSVSSLLHAVPPESQSTGALYPISEDSALPWMFRRHEWFRWRHSKSKRSVAPAEAPVISPGSIREALHRVPESEASCQSGIPTPREPLLNTTYHAQLGHILHHVDTASMRRPGSVIDFIKSEKGRAFCNTFPGSPFFTRHLESGSASDRSALKFRESFVLKFIPSPWADRSNFDSFPPVRITLPADLDAAEVNSPNITVLNSTSYADILLPNDYCDIRFERQEGMSLNVDAIPVESNSHFGGIDIEEWQRYMRGSRLDRTQDYKLRAAAQLQIHIPLSLMNFPEISEAGLSGRSRPVDYVFAGMEHRQTTSIVQDGLTMSHSAIEAGSGGRTTELRISFDPAEQQLEDATSPNAGFDAFVNHSMECISSLANWMKGTPR